MFVRTALAIALILILTPVAAHPRLAVAAWTQAAPPATAQAPAPAKQPDVIFVPTPDSVVHAMLEVAKVTRDDVVYDLGCGDGRIVIAAVKDYGARGVGIDVDPQRIAEATANAEKAGVGSRVRFLQQDLFESDIHEATVVTLYLLPSLNLKLRPKLWSDLKPGTRVVSHAFDMGPDWQPEQKLTVEGRNVYFWTVPKRSTAEGSDRGHDRHEG